MSEEISRSKDPRLGPGSLWAALPIPACRALTYAGEVKASQVLFALVLHSNGSCPVVYPSRATIIKYSGVGKNSITAALNTLVRFGFIKINHTKLGINGRNEYEILRSCWHWNEFNEIAGRYKVPKGLCRACRIWVYGDEWYTVRGKDRKADVLVRVHKNCGGYIKELTKAQMKEVKRQEELAVMPPELLGGE